MITTNNYHEKIKGVDFSSLPEALRKGQEYVKKVTNNGAHWSTYNASEAIKKVVDVYFAKLSEFLVKQGNKSTSKSAQASPQPKKQSGVKKAAPAKQETADPNFVERIPDEIRFIKRFVGFDGKVKTKEDYLRFINTLQKAILEKKIRKSSPYVKEIEFIQKELIEKYNTMGAKAEVSLNSKMSQKLKEIAKSEKVFTSVGLIKRYINLNGKTGIKDKAKQLLSLLEKAYEKGNIRLKDPYSQELRNIKHNLEEFLADKGCKVLEIERNELNGLQGILGCNCKGMNGIEAAPRIMNSLDFANLQFQTLGFRGKWLELIGDPSKGFTMMVYGRPKMGKSYLCVEFAGYLARNHGRVLYVAKEEGLDKTLQDKLNDKDVAHPSLDVTGTLPASLRGYGFVFLDSVNKLGLSADDLTRLKAANRGTSFIYVFQTTKDGKFRGANTFQHDVDSVIEVPEKGKAVQFGRFNAGGEITIF